MNNHISFKAESETVAQTIIATLTRCDFRVVRSFDLRSALATHEGCACPYHGTTHCTCQFIVLLVYSSTAGPLVITVHSYDTQAQVRLVLDNLTQPNLALAGHIITILEEMTQALHVSTAPPAEVIIEVE